MGVSPKNGGAGVTRPARTLTSSVLGSLKAAPTPYRVPDARTPGLAARVATNGCITWDCSFRISGGRVRRVSLGRWPQETSLTSARERTDDLVSAAREGRDLLTEEGQGPKCDWQHSTDAEVPKGPGTYVLLDKSKAIYVGQSVGMRARVQEHRYAKKIKFDAVTAIPCSKSNLDYCEMVLIALLKPPLNRAMRHAELHDESPLQHARRICEAHPEVEMARMLS